MTNDVVILGGGVAGLYAALKLQEKNVKVTVIEKESCVGGMCRSIYDGAFTFDLGSHIVHTNDDIFKRFIIDILGDELLERDITAKSYFDFKFHNFPPIFEDIFEMPLNERIQIIFDLIIGYFNKYRSKKGTFEEQLKFLAGECLYIKYYEGFTRKFWGIDPLKLSSEWVPKRVIPRFIGRSAVASEWQAYPKHGGIQTIPERMAKRVSEQGGIIHLNANLTGILHQDKIATGVIFETEKEQKTITCNGIIYTIPFPILLNYFKIENNIKFRSMIFLFLKIQNTKILKDCTIAYFPSKELPFTRIFELNKYSPSNSPDGYTSLGVEIPCTFGDDMWSKTDDELAGLIISYLDQIKIIKSNDVKGYNVNRQQWAYPVHNIEFYQEIDRLRNSINLQNVFLAGRMGYFYYWDMCKAMENAGKACDILMNKLNKP